MFDDVQKQRRTSEDAADRLEVGRRNLPRVPDGGGGPSPVTTGQILPMARKTDSRRNDLTPTLRWRSRSLTIGIPSGDAQRQAPLPPPKHHGHRGVGGPPLPASTPTAKDLP